MNKKLKILLISSLLLVVIAGGYLLYIFQFKEYEVADEKIEEIMEDAYDVELPNGTKLVVKTEEGAVGKLEKRHPERKDREEGAAETASVTSGGDERKKSASDRYAASTSTRSKSKDNRSSDSTSSTTGTAPAQAASTTTTITVGDIKRKYERSISDLEEQVDQKINTIIMHAKEEYHTNKQNGESTSYAYFYTKYIGAAENLEAQTDMVFEGIVSSLEKDLEVNNFNKAYSQSFRDQYAAQKKARRDRIMKDAMK